MIIILITKALLPNFIKPKKIIAMRNERDSIIHACGTTYEHMYIKI